MQKIHYNDEELTMAWALARDESKDLAHRQLARFTGRQTLNIALGVDSYHFQQVLDTLARKEYKENKIECLKVLEESGIVHEADSYGHWANYLMSQFVPDTYTRQPKWHPPSDGECCIW
jgi:hypothetical protein